MLILLLSLVAVSLKRHALRLYFVASLRRLVWLRIKLSGAIRRSRSSSSCAACANSTTRCASRTTKELALQIRHLPVVPNKLKLAGALAELVDRGRLRDATLCRKSPPLWPRRCASSLRRENRASPTLSTLSWPPWCATSICRRRRTILSLPQPWQNWKPTMPNVRAPTSRLPICRARPGICRI